MRILVTGANGLLGQKLVTLLSAMQGTELIATGRGANRNPPGSYRYLSADLTQAQAVSDLLNAAQPEAIIHSAAMTQVDECELNQNACYQTNAIATENLLNAAAPYQPFFLYVSTDFVFDGLAGPYKESDHPHPVSYYGESKLMAEQLVSGSGLKCAIARTVLVYGVAHDPSRSNIVLWVKKSLENNQAIRVVTDQWRTPTLAEDLAYGCWLIVQKQKPGVFHLSGSEGMSPYELALKVANFFELEPSLVTPVDASTFTQPGKRPPQTGFIIDKARRELGFRPTSFYKGLEVVREQLGGGSAT